MKLFFTLLMTILFAPLSAQLYNGNFENWISFQGALLLQGWEIYAYGDAVSVTQDFDAYQGMYAARVEAIPVELGAYGNASTIMDIEEIPSSLDFYVKASSEFGGVSVEMIFYNGEETVETFSWYSAEEEIVDWTFVSIPIEQDLPEVTTARININAEVGDFAPGTAVISVDQMAFGNTTGLDNVTRNTLELYPNPANEVIRIGESADVNQVEIRDLTGKLVGRYSNAEIQNGISIGKLSPAYYSVIAHLKSGEMTRQKLVVSR